MNRRLGSFTAFAVLALSAAHAVPPAKPIPANPIVGTWTLNVAKSTYSSRPPYKRACQSAIKDLSSRAA